MSKLVTRTTILVVYDNCLECPRCLDLTKPEKVDENGNKFFKLENSTLIVHPKIRTKENVLIDNPWTVRCGIDGTFKINPDGCDRQLFFSEKESLKINQLKQV